MKLDFILFNLFFIEFNFFIFWFRGILFNCINFFFSLLILVVDWFNFKYFCLSLFKFEIILERFILNLVFNLVFLVVFFIFLILFFNCFSFCIFDCIWLEVRFLRFKFWIDFNEFDKVCSLDVFVYLDLFNVFILLVNFLVLFWRVLNWEVIFVFIFGIFILVNLDWIFDKFDRVFEFRLFNLILDNFFNFFDNLLIFFICLLFKIFVWVNFFNCFWVDFIFFLKLLYWEVNLFIFLFELFFLLNNLFWVFLLSLLICFNVFFNCFKLFNEDVFIFIFNFILFFFVDVFSDVNCFLVFLLLSFILVLILNFFVI